MCLSRLVPGLNEPHPRTKDAGMGPATPRELGDPNMVAKNAQKSAPKPARAPEARQATTLELVIRLAPSAVQAEKIATAYAFDPVDYDGIRRPPKSRSAFPPKHYNPP